MVKNRHVPARRTAALFLSAGIQENTAATGTVSPGTGKAAVTLTDDKWDLA